MGGVLEREGTLELANSHLEFFVLGPLGIEVDQLYGGLSGPRCIGALHLSTPVEVAYLAVENHTEQAQVERVGVFAFGVFALILQHTISRELEVLHPGGHFDGALFLVFLSV